MNSNLQQVYIIDMDGTLYRGDEVLDGAAEFVRHVKNKPYLLMTNCPIHSPKKLSQKLAAMGMEVPSAKIINSGQIALEKLQSASLDRIFLIGSPDLRQMALDRGMMIDEEAPDAVLVGQEEGVTEQRLGLAAKLLAQGVPGYCTNIDRYVPRGARTVPHTGKLVEKLEKCSGRKIINLGKPQRSFVDIACRKFGCEPKQLCIVGDNMDTDIAMGHRYGAKTYLVLTGISDGKKFGEIKPTKVFANLHELIHYEFNDFCDNKEG